MELAGFCRRELPRLVGALTLYTGDPAVASELAQEALVRAVDAWPRVRRMASPGGWVHRVALNLARSRFRRRQAERRAAARLGPPVAHEDADVATAVAVRSAVAALPERQRRVLVLRYYLDVPLAEAAAALHISQPAAASLTYRAVRALGALLDEPLAEEAHDAR